MEQLINEESLKELSFTGAPEKSQFSNIQESNSHPEMASSFNVIPVNVFPENVSFNNFFLRLSFYSEQEPIISQLLKKYPWIFSARLDGFFTGPVKECLYATGCPISAL
jgi:hypothetical protein